MDRVTRKRNRDSCSLYVENPSFARPRRSSRRRGGRGLQRADGNLCKEKKKYLFDALQPVIGLLDVPVH